MKNRALQVRMVRTDQPADNAQDVHISAIDPKELNELVKDQVQHIALLVGAALVTKKAAETVSEVIILAAKRRYR